jgi:hypothetical protein
VNSRRLGASDEQILQSIVGLTQEDLQAAWDYLGEHPAEIDADIRVAKLRMSIFQSSDEAAIRLLHFSATHFFANQICTEAETKASLAKRGRAKRCGSRANL